MKKYNIILISRHANFTKAVVNREDYLLTEIKYEEYNVARLSFESVRQVVDFRMDDKDGGAMAKKFGIFFAFFIDNTETLFQSMRLLHMDKKYNKKEFLFKDFENPPIKDRLDK
jgi:hypothetical protein